MTWVKRVRDRLRGTPPDQGLTMVASISASMDGAHGSWVATEQLLEQLLDLDAQGDRDASLTVLEMLANRPRLIVRLDEYTRQFTWQIDAIRARMEAATDLTSVGPTGLIVLALASLHRSGYVREQAVTRIVATGETRLMPWLVLRTDDWVKQVRQQARIGLVMVLAEQPQLYLRPSMGMALRIDGRLRGGFARSQVIATMLADRAAARNYLSNGLDLPARRLALELAVAHRWLDQPELLATAQTERDVKIRVQAAEALCREAVWTKRIDVLQRLARARFAEVRGLAITGMIRAGHADLAVSFLDDPAALVRAIARYAARLTGADAKAHYQAAVQQQNPPAGSLIGLAEVGGPGDAGLLEPILTHRDATIRAAALKALQQLDSVPVQQTITLLHDPSPTVVRQAAQALRPIVKVVPQDLLWSMIEHERAEIRRAGYRLLAAQDLHTRLRAALMLVNDPDQQLARRAVADLTGVARDAAAPQWRHNPRPLLDITPSQRDALQILAQQASPHLPGETGQMLRTWLADRPI